MGETSIKAKSSGTMLADRRLHRRAPLKVPVLLDATNTWQKAHCENVSAGGVAVRCERALPVGIVVDVYFELPFGVAIEARARVVRWDDGVLALQFVELDHESTVALRGFTRISGTISAVSVTSDSPPGGVEQGR